MMILDNYLSLHHCRILSLSSLTLVTELASILKEKEIQMLKEIDTDIITCHSSAATLVTSRLISSSSAALPSPNKNLKGISKVLSHCFTDRAVQQLSPQQ